MDSISTVWVSRFVCPSHKSSPLHGRNVVSKSFTNEPCNPFPLRTHFLINQGWGKGEKGKSKAELEASLGTKIEQLSGGEGEDVTVQGREPIQSVVTSLLPLHPSLCLTCCIQITLPCSSEFCFLTDGEGYLLSFDLSLPCIKVKTMLTDHRSGSKRSDLTQSSRPPPFKMMKL